MTQPFGACCVCVQVPSLGRPVLYKGTLDCIVKVLPFMFCCRFLFHLSMSHTHPLCPPHPQTVRGDAALKLPAQGVRGLYAGALIYCLKVGDTIQPKRCVMPCF